MPVGALFGFGALLVSVFGARTVIQQHRTGDAGWRAPPTRAAWAGDGLFTLGVGSGIAVPVLALVDAVEPIDALNRLPIQVTGAVLLIAGGGIALVAQAQMGAAWRAGIDVSGRYELVREGLFRVVRNPFYLGMIMAAAGVALMVPNVVAVAGWVAVVVGCEIDVRLVEEPHLEAAKGCGYREYAAVTGRFLPRVGRTSRP